MTDVFVDEEGLELNDPPRLVWVRVQDAVGLIWRDNPKRHDMQSLTTSIERYGFQEPAKFDAKLHRVGQQVDDDPLGAIKSGNGRIEAVAWLESQGKELPRGLALNASGEWMLPMLVGTDARSGAVAQAYAVDANNLTLAGGDFDGFDMARLWGPEYVDLLSGLDELPVSVDAEMLASFMTFNDVPNLDDLEDEYGEPEPTDGWPFIRVQVAPSTLDLWNEVIGQIAGEDDNERVIKLLNGADLEALSAA